MKDKEPIEIKFSFEREQIIFHAGNEDFFIPRDKMLALIDSAGVANQFDRLVTPDDEIGDMDNFDTVVNYLFWKGRGSTMAQIAESLAPPITVKKLENWLSRHADYIERIKTEKAQDLAAVIARLDGTYAGWRRTAKGD